MSHSDADRPLLEVSPGDVSIDGEGRVQIVSARLAEAVKMAIRLEAEFGSRPITRAATNQYACGLNGYQCGKAAIADALDQT